MTDPEEQPTPSPEKPKMEFHKPKPGSPTNVRFWRKADMDDRDEWTRIN